MRVAAMLAALVMGLAPALAQDARRPIKRDNVLKRAGAQFDKMDADKDGTLDAAEMNAVIEEAVAKLRARMQARFAEADANKDGEVTREEFVNARGAWFDSVDTNADGAIDPAELKAYLAERSRKAREGGK